MESMPPVKLGATILVFFSATLIPRHFLEKWWVFKANRSQSGRQMALDLGLTLIAGAGAALCAVAFLGFPVASGWLLAIGFGVAAFFIAVDMALHRERQVILHALEQDRFLPPERFYSVTRKFFLVAVAALVINTAVIFLVVSRDIAWLGTAGQSQACVASAQSSVGKDLLYIIAVFLALAVNLIRSYSKNLKLLFENEIQVLEGVSQGDLSRMAPVVTNDEFGVIAGHTNQMIRGLNHRKELLGELKLAEEVQQSLLPSGAPKTHRLDIAGASRYCSQTGGDYFDFLELDGGRVALVMADASGHGVGSALHMATARAIFRTLARQHRSPAAAITTLNRLLTQDTWDTGRFMTFFLAVLDRGGEDITWVRAGHDPAFLYDPEKDAFQRLEGKGIALGLYPEWEYEQYSVKGFSAGKVLVIATDGIWETMDPHGAMFGKERVEEIIRQNASLSAEAVMNAVLDAANQFRGGEKQEDDMTIIVAKAL